MWLAAQKTSHWVEVNIFCRGRDQPLELGAGWVRGRWGLWNSRKVYCELTLKINKPCNSITEGGHMLSSPYLTTLKLSVFQTMYATEEEIALTTRKLNSDQRAKAKTYLANHFKIDLLTFSVKFWITQGVWEFFSEKTLMCGLWKIDLL